VDARAGMPAVRPPSGPDANRQLDRSRAVAQAIRLSSALLPVAAFLERLGSWVRNGAVPAAMLRPVADLAEELRDACQDVTRSVEVERRGRAELMAAVLASPPTVEEVQGCLRFESRSEDGVPASVSPCWDGQEAPSGFTAPFEIGGENVCETRHDRESLSARAGRRFDPLSFVYGSASLAAGAVLCLAIVLLVQRAGVGRPRQPIDWLPPVPPRSRDAPPPSPAWMPPEAPTPSPLEKISP